MAYRKKAFVPPQILPHKASGQAYCRYDGKDYYLGPWNGEKTPPLEVLRKYQELCSFLEERFDARAAGVVAPSKANDLAVVEAVDLYLHHLRTDEDGDLRDDGTLRSHYADAVMHLRPLVARYGTTDAEAFSAHDLKEVRKAVRQPEPVWWRLLEWPETRRPPKQWGRSTANKMVRNVCRMFDWLESEGLVEAGRAAHLRTVSPLKVQSVEAATVETWVVDLTKRYASPQIAALLTLQQWTAARPTELLRMRPCDVEQGCEIARDDGGTDLIWVYTPRDERGQQAHKTAYLGHDRKIPLCRECQDVLRPFLDRADDAFLFRPAEVAAWWRDHRQAQVRPMRKTPVYPSEMKARAKAKRARKRRKSKRKHAPRYTWATYYQAVQYAVAAARRDGHDLPDFKPYDIRHARITEIQQKYGWDYAQAVAGHESQNVTRRYAHERHERALRIAAGTQDAG